MTDFPGHGSSPAPRAFTRRRSYRQDVCDGLTLRPEDPPGPALDVRTYDVSRGGVGLICPRALVVGSFYQLHTRTNRLVLSTGRVRVVTCTQVGAAAFQVGAEFV